MADNLTSAQAADDTTLHNAPDITEPNDGGFSGLSERMDSIENMLTQMNVMISTIQKAQESFVAMGGSIHENIPQSGITNTVVEEEEPLLPLDLLDWNI